MPITATWELRLGDTIHLLDLPETTVGIGTVVSVYEDHWLTVKTANNKFYNVWDIQIDRKYRSLYSNKFRLQEWSTPTTKETLT